jgi:hypothetical protein
MLQDDKAGISELTRLTVLAKRAYFVDQQNSWVGAMKDMPAELSCLTSPERVSIGVVGNEPPGTCERGVQGRCNRAPGHVLRCCLRSTITS